MALFGTLLADFLTSFDVMISAGAYSFVIFVVTINKTVFFNAADGNSDLFLAILTNNGLFGNNILDGFLDSL